MIHESLILTASSRLVLLKDMGKFIVSARICDVIFKETIIHIQSKYNNLWTLEHTWTMIHKYNVIPSGELLIHVCDYIIENGSCKGHMDPVKAILFIMSHPVNDLEFSKYEWNKIYKSCRQSTQLLLDRIIGTKHSETENVVQNIIQRENLMDVKYFNALVLGIIKDKKIKERITKMQHLLIHSAYSSIISNKALPKNAFGWLYYHSDSQMLISNINGLFMMFIYEKNKVNNPNIDGNDDTDSTSSTQSK